MYSGPSIIQTPQVLDNRKCSDKWNDKVNVLDNFPVVLTIAIELLKWETLLYTKKQQVAAG